MSTGTRSALEENLSSLKKGDRPILVDISPKYMQYVDVEVLSVSRKEKSARVKLAWTGPRADERIVKHRR